MLLSEDSRIDGLFFVSIIIMVYYKLNLIRENSQDNPKVKYVQNVNKYSLQSQTLQTWSSYLFTHADLNWSSNQAIPKEC